MAFTRPDYKVLAKEFLVLEGIINFPDEALNFSVMNLRWVKAVVFETGKFKRIFAE